MSFIYKIPGYILLLFGGFCLSWGGLIIRQFEQAGVWEVLFLGPVELISIGLTMTVLATYGLTIYYMFKKIQKKFS